MHVLVRTDDETELQRNELSRGRRRRVYARRHGLPKMQTGRRLMFLVTALCAYGLIQKPSPTA
ncbi:hypothetical protein HanHA300_Chr15g0562991 [Helianthus annuus]|nr:hypothetical protein HanHA300_Chr15g0562991 [Helianthus annuus]KAJ0472894.1 hypothetical protein HanHA89_Chr15g0612211 [Helianthus annuus]KAJ0648501.1 hypothetical protein HanLR1_Chr15g0573631 [Helianthus annuus]